jgi:hypothetical protein
MRFRAKPEAAAGNRNPSLTSEENSDPMIPAKMDYQTAEMLTIFSIVLSR